MVLTVIYAEHPMDVSLLQDSTQQLTSSAAP